MKIKLFRLLSAMTLLCLYAIQANAQVTSSNYFIPTFYPKAPNTAAFTKYGDYQVNLFTGMPDISIPLYTIEAGGLKVPITLSYHASGIRVSDVASWVGLGWSTSTGGTVSRKIVGGADDGAGGYLSGTLRQATSINLNVDNDMDYVDRVTKGQNDTRPDIFSYDFPGHSGKFFYDGTNSFKLALIPFSPINIRPILSGTGGYNVLDEHGNNYIFGSSVVETSYSLTQTHPAIGATSSWMLEKMTSQNRRDTITFSYTSQLLNYPDAVSETDIIKDEIDAVSGMTNPYTPGYSQGPTNTSSSYVNEQLVHQINFKNGKVVFELDTAARQDFDYGSSGHDYGLKDIQVYIYNYKTKIMEIQKTIKFWKSYFNPGVTGAKRLRLDSIQILDKAGSIVQHYRFGYNNAHTMPAYGSLQKDYWGFYNGKANTSLTPQMTVAYQPMTTGYSPTTITIGSSVANGRDCDSNYMQACVLDTIYYPTGGHTIFTYQTNQYLASGVLKLAGGLRIQSIASYDGISSTPIVKTYQYNLSTARANFLLDNCFFVNTQTHRYWTQTTPYGTTTCPYILTTEQVRTFVSNPRVDLEPFDAASVVYPQVTEYTGTSGSNIGRTDYVFRDLSDITSTASLTGTPVITSYYYARGQLLSKTENLRKSDGTYQPVKVETNSYTAFPEHRYVGVGLTAGLTYADEGITSDPIYTDNCETTNDYYNYVYSNYDILSDDNYLTSTTTNIYDINDATKYTTSTVNYKYDNIVHQQVTRTQHTDSKGNLHVAVSKYPYDYMTTGNTTNNILLDSMINRNMQADVIEKWDSVKNVTTGLNGVTGGQLNRYKSGSLLNTIVPSTISTLSVAKPLTDFLQTVGLGGLPADSRYVQMISFDQYDAQNNLKQYTPRNSTTTSVIWDYLNENPIAQVKNSTIANIAYTSFEADGKGNWSYSGPTVTNPTAPTGSRVYSLSGGSITSPGTDNVHSYVLSYWSNNGAATVYFASGYVTGTAMATTNGWTYYEHIIPVGNSYAVVSGTTTIDELRMYPVGAQMTTYAYDPSGVTAIADTKGGISHFEYDAFQRLKNIKDWYGNIVNNYGYHTYDQTASNDAIAATVFTRDNCPSGTSPQSTTYSVPAGRYYSSTKASANLEAQYDLQTNGQTKADNPAICGCPITTATFTLTNSSGYTGWQAVFTGGTNPTYNFPNSGSSTVQIPVGTYTSVYIGPIGSATHTFTLGSRTPITGAHSATFSSVVIATSGSTDTSLTVQ